MYLIQNQDSTLQFLTTLNGFELSLQREDALHPLVSGNKFRKLKFNLEQAKQSGHNTLLTFGGTYSNHLAATAAAGNIMGFKTIGIVRGEENRPHNPTLSYCQSQGMVLQAISREDYRQKNEDEFIAQLRRDWGDFYLLPEGGTNALAVAGCKEILNHQHTDFDTITCSVGTGGTLAGLIESAQPHQEVVGFSALRNPNLPQEIKKWTKMKNWSINSNYTFGGYAKVSVELIQFINTFNKNFKTPLDPVYTGKLLFGIFDMIKTKQWRTPKKILIIHTGGLQGIQGMNQKLSKKQWPEIVI